MDIADSDRPAKALGSRNIAMVVAIVNNDNDFALKPQGTAVFITLPSLRDFSQDQG
jgi:hypothetical protein